MTTYLLINIIFVLIVCLILRVKLERPTKQILMTLSALLLLTLVFDSVLIYFHIVEYAKDHLLGLYWGLAPVEDYFYPLLAVIIIPILWKRFGKKND